MEVLCTLGIEIVKHRREANPALKYELTKVYLKLKSSPLVHLYIHKWTIYNMSLKMLR